MSLVKTMSSSRINHQPAFVLSSFPWRENSLRVELLTRDYGRVGVLARSARTRGSELRGILVPFVPISVSWFGSEEWKTLHRAEWVGGWALPQGKALFSAMYVNELTMKLLLREDPHPPIFDALHDILQVICQQPEHFSALRQFEWRLLQALGWLPDFLRDGLGNAVDENAWYRVEPESPIERLPHAPNNSPDNVVQGAVLLALARQNLPSEYFQAAFRLMRFLVAFRVPQLHSRLILQQLQHLKSNGLAQRQTTHNKFTKKFDGSNT